RDTSYPLRPRAAPTTMSNAARSRVLPVAIGFWAGEELARGSRTVKAKRRRRLPAPALVPPHPLRGSATVLRLDRRREACGEIAHAVATTSSLGRDRRHAHEMPALRTPLDEHGHDRNTGPEREHGRAGR